MVGTADAGFAGSRIGLDPAVERPPEPRQRIALAAYGPGTLSRSPMARGSEKT
jgi:hypothetical protein